MPAVLRAGTSNTSIRQCWRARRALSAPTRTDHESMRDGRRSTDPATPVALHYKHYPPKCTVRDAVTTDSAARSTRALPPVVVLHGVLANANTYHSVLKRDDFAADRHLYALDLRNHGASPHAADMSYGAMARDVLAFMDARRVDRACLLGHSMGGKLAMRLAWEHAPRVSELIVVDSAPVAYTNHDTEDGGWPAVEGNSPEGVILAMSDMDEAVYRSRAAVSEALRQRGVTNDSVRQFALTNLVPDEQHPGRYRWRVNVDALRHSIRQLMGDAMPGGGGSHSDVADRAVSRTFSGPTLFIRGAQSGYVRDAHLPLIRQLFPQATIVTVADAGHWLQSEKPDAFVAAVNRFLNRAP
eukprot:ctg_1778.g556